MWQSVQCLYLVLYWYTNDAASQWLPCSVVEWDHRTWTETNVNTAELEWTARWTCSLHVVPLYCSCSTSYKQFSRQEWAFLAQIWSTCDSSYTLVHLWLTTAPRPYFDLIMTLHYYADSAPTFSPLMTHYFRLLITITLDRAMVRGPFFAYLWLVIIITLACLQYES